MYVKFAASFKVHIYIFIYAIYTVFYVYNVYISKYLTFGTWRGYDRVFCIGKLQYILLTTTAKRPRYILFRKYYVTLFMYIYMCNGPFWKTMY